MKKNATLKKKLEFTIFLSVIFFLNCTQLGMSHIPPLHRAAIDGDLTKVRQLVKEGASVHSYSKYGYTPLHSTEDIDVAKFLLEKGAKINSRARINKYTPLHRVKSYQFAEFLIKNGANVNAKDDSGNTPLSKSKSREIAELLLKNGANVNSRNNKGRTEIFSGEYMDLLLKYGANVNARDHNGHTPIFSLIEGGKFSEAKYLIKHGAKVNAVSRSRWTPLHWAIIERSWDSDVIDMIKFLLDNGANMNAKDKYGQSPLDIAKEESKKIYEFMLEYSKKK